MSLRIPAWLAGSTAALLVAAAARVAEIRGVAGFVELAQTVALAALCAYALIVGERYEAHPLAHILFWPRPRFRRLLFLALIALVDCYLVLNFVLGGKFVGDLV